MSPLQRQLVAELRQAYSESGLTYDQIAARGELSRMTVYRALNGKPKVHWTSMIRIADVFGLRVRLDAR